MNDTMKAERIKVEILENEQYGPYIIRKTWANGRIETTHGFLTVAKANDEVSAQQSLYHQLNAAHPDQPPVVFDLTGKPWF